MSANLFLRLKMRMETKNQIDIFVVGTAMTASPAGVFQPSA